MTEVTDEGSGVYKIVFPAEYTAVGTPHANGAVSIEADALNKIQITTKKSIPTGRGFTRPAEPKAYVIKIDGHKVAGDALMFTRNKFYVVTKQITSSI